MAYRIQVRRDTTDNWTSVNPVLAQGELGYDLDLNILKVGNGIDNWINLVEPSADGGVQKVADETERLNLTPTHGDIVYQLDNDTLYAYDGTEWFAVTSSGGAVDSVFGRTGIITAELGDYKSEQIEITQETDVTELLNVKRFLDFALSPNTIEGFEYTKAVDGASITFAEGEYLLRTTTSDKGELQAFKIDETVIPLYDGATHFLYGDYNDGSPIITATLDPLEINFTTQSPFFLATRVGTDIAVLDAREAFVNKWHKQARKEIGAYSFSKMAGTSFYMPIPDEGRFIYIAPGNYYYADVIIAHRAFNTVPSDMGGNGDTFYEVYDSGDAPSAFSYVRSESKIQLDNMYYNDGSGTLQELDENKFNVHLIYMMLDPQDPWICDWRPIGQFDTLADAIALKVPQFIPDLDMYRPAEAVPYASSVLIAKVIIQKNSENIAGFQSEELKMLDSNVPLTHNDLKDIQGGEFGDYQHLTSTQITEFQNKEDSLGNPAENDFILSSQTDGTRSWITPPSDEIAQENRVFLNEIQGAGLVSGGELTITGTTTFTVDAGKGYLINSSDELQQVTWNAFVDVEILGNDVNYIRINENGQLDLTLDGTYDISRYVELGYVFGGAGGTMIIDYAPVPAWISRFDTRVNSFLRDGIKAIVNFGLGVSEGTTPFTLNIGAGEIYAFLNNIPLESTNTFVKMYYTSDLGWVTKTGDDFENLLEAGIWNDITQPADTALVDMTPGWFKTDIVFRNVSGQTYVICGQAEYATLDEAVASQLATLPEALTNVVALLAKIHMKEGSTSILSDGEITDIRPNFERVFGYGTAAAAAVQEHSSLTGLLNDDHTQYYNETRGDARYLRKSNISSWALEATKPSYDLTELTDVDDTDKAEGKILKVDALGNHIYVDDESGTDGKVKYDSADPDSGYISDKIIAGEGISVAEGSGADENKLVVTNIDKGSDFTETDPTVPDYVKSIDELDISNWNTAFGWGDHSTEGYLTSFTETDPTVPDYVKSIAELDISNWNTAFGWGDHSTEGYLTSFTETDPLSLHLDQTTPQEIVNGIPKLVTDFGTIVDPKHIINKEYLDKGLTVGAGYIANIYFRSDESDKPDIGDKYKRISYNMEENETILNRVINSSDGEVLYETYLYDSQVDMSITDPGVYCVNYKVKASVSADTHLIFELFVLKTDNSEVVLFREESPQVRNTDYLTLRTHSNQPGFDIDPTDRIGVKIYCITDSVDDLIVSTVIGGLNGSYFSTPGRLRHSIFRDIDAPNQHPISAITNLQTELDSKVNKEVLEALKEPTGIEDRTQSTLTFAVETNLAKVSIEPNSPATEFNIWVKGEKIIIDELKSITLPDIEGLHVIYFDSDGILQSSLNPNYNDIKFIISEQVIIALLYWDATNKQIVYDGEERHGTIMDGATHAYLHIDRGLVINSGLGLSSFNIGNGSSNSHAQFGVNQGIVADEDLRLTIDEITSTTGLPILYRSGSDGDWRKVTQSGFACYRGTNTRLSYNEFTGTAWQLTEVSNNDFVLYHIFATTGYTNKIYSIIGQNQYGNATQARAGAVEEISSLLLEGLPTPEIKPIGTVIFQTGNYGNLVNARIVLTDEGANYVDWRASSLPRGTTPTYHGNLTGLNEDHHLQYLRTDGTRDVIGVIAYDTDKTFTTDQDIISKKYVDDGLNTKEDYLGEPLEDDYVLSSKADGTRVWIEKPLDGEIYDDTAIFELANNNSLKFDETMGAGLASGGQITITGATTFNVSAGIGYVLNSSGKFTRVEWDSIDSEIIGEGPTFVRINELGNLDLTLDPNFDFTNYIELGYVFGGTGGSQILDLSPTPAWISKFNWRVNDFFRAGIKALIDSGCGVSEGTTPFSLNIGSGVIRAFLNTLNVNSTSTFNKIYLTADYGWIPKDDELNNLLEPNIYNDITENYIDGNPLVELTDGYWKNDLVFRNSSGQVYVACGQAEYATLEESKNSQLPMTPEMLRNVSPYLARVHMQKDGTSIEEIIDIRPNFERVFGYGTAAAAAVQEHSSLTGLENDDHIQYYNETRGDLRYLKQESISSWALETSKPNYNLDEISDGTTYKRVTDSDISGWNSLVTFPGFDTLFNDYGFTDNSTNWDTAFGWGDHSGLYSLLGHNHSGTYEPANDNIQTHIEITSGNPHGTSKSDIGLANVTNDAQVKKRSSSTNGRVPTWDGITGDALNDGLTVGTDANNLVQLDSLAKLPAVDGSQLTNLPSGMTDPMTTRGDMIVRGSEGTTRLARGSARQTIQNNGTDVLWSSEIHIEVRTSNPASPVAGRMWYRSDLE